MRSPPILDVPAGALGPFACPSASVPGQEPRSPQGPFRGRRAEQEEVDINSIREYFILLRFLLFLIFFPRHGHSQTFLKQVHREEHPLLFGI